MADAFQILADPTRRRLVEELRGGERSVGDLVKVVGIGQPGARGGAGCRVGGGCGAVRPEGRGRLYALRPGPVVEPDGWMRGYRDMWEKRLDRFEAEAGR